MRTFLFRFSFVICIMNVFSCHGQIQNLAMCKRDYKNGVALYDSFIQTHDTPLLEKAIPLLSKSTLCNETRQKALLLKITLISLLKSYSWAYSVVDSSDETDFREPYQKKMYLAFFKAKQFELGGDLQNRDKILDSAARNIQSYINFSGKFQKDSYVDLYNIKSVFLDRKEYILELDSLVEKYPNQKNFFEGLKDISQASVSASPR